ncbi:hypothetical protein [Methylobacterium nigriterrae]|uniref:hypothetical protein n=1 Tax=Methylobacterium nigriterrae TaxID=3127512 RepID=UPI0030135246
MMRVAVVEVGSGLHPEEVVVSVLTRDGEAKLAVDKEAIHGKTLRVGYPIGREGDFYLIELPRESFQGTWRVWVSKDHLTHVEEKSTVYA